MDDASEYKKPQLPTSDSQMLNLPEMNLDDTPRTTSPILEDGSFRGWLQC